MMRVSCVWVLGVSHRVDYLEDHVCFMPCLWWGYKEVKLSVTK
jgi:hypothetical protein